MTFKQANNMIDDQPATSYSFASSDATPAAIIDLGKITTLRRISTLYSPRHLSVDFFILQSLPGAEQGNKAPAAASSPKTLRLDDSALAKLTSVGSIMDEGSGRAAINFPEMSGRYIMVKWTPATQQDTAFSVADLSAFGGNKNASLIASSTSGVGREEIAFDV